MTKRIKTTVDGTEYTLEFDGMYKWTRKGSIANALKSSYTSPIEAEMAFNIYNSSLEFQANKLSGEENLEELSSKKDLLGYAEAKGIEVPEKLKQPSAIKKFLMGDNNG